MTRVEQFEVIRREHFVHGKSIRRISREQRVHRRTVRQALTSSIPPPRKRPERDPPVLTHRLRGLVDRWVRQDRQAPRKQRHTARRMYVRLAREEGYGGSESTVRRYVARRRRELGGFREAYVPQDHLPGEEAEVDWYEAWVEFPWGRHKVQLFQMRACYSGREFHMAFPRQTQQAFLEGHVAALDYFGGSFARLRYDNLSAAVKKVLRGRRREETDRFVALRSHYLFQAQFCRAGREGAREKGGVESGVGRFRRNHLVPVPKVEGWDALNRRLLDLCAEDDGRRIEGRAITVSESWAEEKPHLRPLPAEPFPTAEVGTFRVDRRSQVRVRTNRYSVPVRLVGRHVEVRVHACRIEAVHGGQVVARHPRLQGRHGERYELDHYLELLWVKPGAFPGCRPLRQAREAGRWPAHYDRLWDELRQRYGEAWGTRQLVDVLMLHRHAAPGDVDWAVRRALQHGCCDAAAVSLLLRSRRAPDRLISPLANLGALSRFERAVDRNLSPYDRLLSVACA